MEGQAKTFAVTIKKEERLGGGKRERKKTTVPSRPFTLLLLAGPSSRFVFGLSRQKEEGRREGGGETTLETPENNLTAGEGRGRNKGLSSSLFHVRKLLAKIEEVARVRLASSSPIHWAFPEKKNGTAKNLETFLQDEPCAFISSNHFLATVSPFD